jgi:tetratricopeptide (TPR) repeat protein
LISRHCSSFGDLADYCVILSNELRPMQLTIRNNTPNELRIKGAQEQPIVLAPLEQRVFKQEDVDGFDLSEARQAGLVSHWTSPPNEIVEKILGILFGLAFLGAIPIAVVAGMDTPNWFPTGLAWKTSVWVIGIALFLLIIALLVIKETKSLRLVVRFLAQALSLIVIIAIGLGLPAATVYFFGGGRTLLSDPSPKLFARLLQVAFIATASLLPVLLFFLYDRFQLNTLRNRLYRDLFRLDRGLKTRSEIDTKYGSQIQEAYGPEDEGRGRLARGTRWPVLVCAFVVTIGWLAAFTPVGEIDSVLVQKPLFPVRSVLTFGFIGAYFFGLQLIARRYSRGDLKPKAYSYITIRILVVVVLSWVLEIFSADSKIVLLLAFLIGILPDEFFTLVKEKFRGQAVAKLTPEAEKHPLTRLEGIDLYDRARLEQEGIVNVESFAHHDLINLVLETQIPVPRLVDWMDQAILYLHVIGNDTVQGQQQPAREKLREYGIRTATDLLACWDAADHRKELDEFKQLLGDSKPYRLEVVRDALLDDEWLERVQDWRNDDERDATTINAVPKTFEGKLRWAAKLENDKSYKEAIATLQEALEIRDGVEARIRLARLFANVEVLSLRNLDLSKAHASQAFTLGKDDLEVMTQLIDINDNNGDTDAALRACETAITLIGDPKKDKRLQQALKELKLRLLVLEKKKTEAIVPSVSPDGKDNGHQVVTTP